MNTPANKTATHVARLVCLSLTLGILGLAACGHPAEAHGADAGWAPSPRFSVTFPELLNLGFETDVVAHPSQPGDLDVIDVDQDGVPVADDCDDLNADVGITNVSVGLDLRDDFADLQEAINAAVGGDTICVAAGLYHAPIVIDRSLTVWAKDGPEATIIDSDYNSRGVIIEDAGGSILSGFTVRGAHVDGAGGDALGGAGVLILRSNKTAVLNNIIEDNHVAGSGGGIAVLDSSEVMLAGNDIFDNSASLGGGVAVANDSLFVTLFENNVSDNEASEVGGGVYMFGAHDAMVQSNTITFNTAAEHAGGIEIEASNDVEMLDNTIDNNTAGQ